MEKTLARAIYKAMEIGKPYTTSELFRLVGDDYFKYVPVDMHPFQANGKPVNTIISNEMWKVVRTGYAKTYKQDESLAILAGVKFGSKSKSYQTYTMRYWVRTK